MRKLHVSGNTRKHRKTPYKLHTLSSSRGLKNSIKYAYVGPVGLCWASVGPPGVSGQRPGASGGALRGSMDLSGPLLGLSWASGGALGWLFGPLWAPVGLLLGLCRV